MSGRKDCRQGKSKTYRKWENKTLSPCLPQFSFGGISVAPARQRLGVSATVSPDASPPGRLSSGPKATANPTFGVRL